MWPHWIAHDANIKSKLINSNRSKEVERKTFAFLVHTWIWTWFIATYGFDVSTSACVKIYIFTLNFVVVWILYHILLLLFNITFRNGPIFLCILNSNSLIAVTWQFFSGWSPDGLCYIGLRDVSFLVHIWNEMCVHSDGVGMICLQLSGACMQSSSSTYVHPIQFSNT